MVSAKISDAASVLSAYTSNVTKVNNSKGTGFNDMLKKSTVDDEKQTPVESTSKVKEKVEITNKEYNTKSPAVTDEKSNETDIPTAEEISNIATLVVDIRKEIAETLNISVEELNEYLDILSLDISDLKTPENMMKLLMEVKNITDQSAVLLDSELSTNVKELITKLSEVVEKMPEMTEEVKEQIDIIDEKDNKYVQITSDDNTETFIDITGDVYREKLAEMTLNNGNSDMSGDTDKHSESEDVFENMVNSINVSANIEVIDGISEAISEITGSYSETEVISQIIERIKVTAKPGMSSMELQLYPEHLGKVTVQVVSKNGGITAHIAAENENVKAIIENQLITLKNAFSEQGIKVDSVEVTVANYGFDQNANEQNEQNNQKSKRNGANVRKNLLDELNGTVTEEVIEETRMEAVGNTVSYKA